MKPKEKGYFSGRENRVKYLLFFKYNVNVLWGKYTIPDAIKQQVIKF